MMFSIEKWEAQNVLSIYDLTDRSTTNIRSNYQQIEQVVLVMYYCILYIYHKYMYIIVYIIYVLFLYCNKIIITE